MPFKQMQSLSGLQPFGLSGRRKGYCKCITFLRHWTLVSCSQTAGIVLKTARKWTGCPGLVSVDVHG